MAAAPWKVQSAPTGPIKKPFADRFSPEAKAAMAEMSAMTQNPAAAEYERLPAWQKPLVAGSDIIQLMGSAPMMGFGEKAVAGARSAFGGGDYETELAEQRRQTNAARQRSGWAGTTGEIASQVGSLPQLIAKKGAPWLAKAGLAAAEGAGFGAASAAGEDRDIASGALWGTLGGAGGSAFADLVKAGGTRVGKAVSNYLAEPSQRAKAAIWDAATKAGLKAADIRAAIKQHGSDVMGVDVLGKRGASMAKQASNLSPEARDIAESRLLGRKAGQNERIVGTLEEAASLPTGSRQTVKGLQEANLAKQRPEINKAYEEARAAGYDLPRTPFEDILSSPMGKQAYDSAAGSLKNRAAVEGGDAASELARLDQTKRELDDIATNAYRVGNKDKGDQAAAMAKKLRDTMDASIAGPEYAKARGLRQRAYKQEEAIGTGANLAKGRIAADLPGKARGISDADELTGLRQGYAAQQAENLLNQGSTEGALNILSRPMQREGYEAALRENAPQLEQRLGTERMFNRSARDVTGGSSTTRQILEAAGAGGVGALTGWLGGSDPFTGGAIGLGLKGGRMLMPTIQRQLATKGAQAAPHVADILTQSPEAIPLERVIPPGVLERGAGAVRDYLAQIIAKGSINVGARGERGQ